MDLGLDSRWGTPPGTFWIHMNLQIHMDLKAFETWPGQPLRLPPKDFGMYTYAHVWILSPYGPESFRGLVLVELGLDSPWGIPPRTFWILMNFQIHMDLKAFESSPVDLGLTRSWGSSERVWDPYGY